MSNRHTVMKSNTMSRRRRKEEAMPWRRYAMPVRWQEAYERTFPPYMELNRTELAIC